jgi:stringent starvation protein B
MTSNRPYLLRALHHWIVDNHLTPHILVEAETEGVEVPDQAVQKGKVILNIDEAAVRELDLGNDWVTFKARFSGREHQVSVPLEAVLAFSQDDGTMPPTDPDTDPDDTPEKRPHLKIVK